MTGTAPLALDHPAAGVYVHYGEQAEPSAANRADVANMGFVVGARCVGVVDTGGSYAVGAALREAIRRVTPLPVCIVINTHGHPDHVFGNAAFLPDHPEFIGHAALRDALRARGPAYLHALRRDLGAAAAGTEIVLPTRGVASTEEVDLGGRVLVLRAWRTAHTDADLTVLDTMTRTAWLGDLLFVGHVPVVDGSLLGFLAVSDALARMPADRVVPGHGRAQAWPAAIEPEQRYLRRLHDEVRAALRAHRTLAQALDSASGNDEGWLLFDDFHRRNMTAAYAELEWAE